MRHRFSIGIFLFLSLLFSCTPAFAQSFPFDHYTASDGLPSNWINAIFQDARGYLWVGGDGGLAVYDGVSFKTYGPIDGLPVPLVWQITESRHSPGTILIGTHGSGLSRLANGKITTLRFGNDVYINTISQIMEDSRGVIWCGTNTGIVQVRGDSISFFRAGIDSGHVVILKELHDGSIIIGTKGTLFRYSPQGGTVTQLPIGTVFPSGLHEDSNGVLWCGTYDGSVLRIEGDRITGRRKTPFGHLDSPVGDKEGNLWFASDNGVIKIPTKDFPTAEVILYSTENGLQENDINVCFIDREDNLWVGGRDRGISKLSSRTIVRFSIDGLQPDVFNSSVTTDKEGRIFAATSTHIREIWKGTDGNWRTFSHPISPIVPGPILPNALAGNMSVAIAPDGQLWVGFTWGGLRSFGITRSAGKRSTLTPVHVLRPGKHIPNAGALGITIDQDNQLWYNTRGGPLAQLDLASLQVRGTYDIGGEVVAGTAQAITMMSDGTMWVARFNGGIGIFAKDGPAYRLQRSMTTADGLPSDRIRSVVERRNGEIWIGTRFDGISIYRDGHLRSLTMKDGLLNNAVWKMVEDEEGRLWVGTSVGLQYTDPDGDGFHPYPRLSGHQIAGLGLIPGKQTLWVATSGGLALYEYGREQYSRVAPLIAVDVFRVNGRDRELQGEPELMHDENFCVLRFNGLSFTDGGLLYRSRLIGLDTAWSEPSGQRIVSFASLDPGSYTFEVRAITADGRESEAPARLSFTILPPWYLSPWTIGLCAGLGGLFVVFYIKVRTRKLEQRSRELEQVVAERTEEVVAQRNRVHEQAEKLRDLDIQKSHFFTNISHEFRTPLTVILGHLERLMEKKPSVEDGDFEVMDRNARRLLQLINQLLDLSKIEAGAMTLRAARADIVVFIRRVIASLLSYAEHKGIALTFNGAPMTGGDGQSAIVVYFDSDKIEKVIVNLLSNALKFTPRNGAINVTVTSGIMDGRHQGQYVEVTVRDSGTGIPAEKLPFVFDRFYQVEDYAQPGFEGTGVGLALVKELVELHHGTVSVKSTEGMGTTFIVRLPLGTAHLDEGEIVEEGSDPVTDVAVAPEYESPVHEEEIDADAIDETRVLVVEDNADLRHFIRDNLSREFTVLEAGNGTDGVRKAMQHVPDLVISDIMMPGMDGYALCAAVKGDEKTNHIPVILLTAKATTENKLEGLETGADDYLTKPFNTQELQVRVRNLIQTRRLLREKFSSEMLLKPAEVTVPSQQKVFLEKVTSAIERHLADEEFSVEVLAEGVGMSRSQLHRKLKALTNKGPNELIRSFRLQRAADLIRQDTGSLAEIAYQVGFGSQAYFTRSFGEEFGCSPTEYKRSIGNADSG